MISIVVPTYNERENIGELVRRLSDSMRGLEYEVVIVDDNSPDGTWKAAMELSSRYPVRVVRRVGERGLASAVVRGFREARGDVIVVMDADLQHPPEDVPRLIAALEEADVAVASRYASGGGVEGWSLARRVISWGATLLARLLLPRAKCVKDPVSGFFAVRRSAIEGVELSPVGYKILLEVLVKGRYRRVAEVPYVFRCRQRGESKLSSREVFKYVKHLLKLMKWSGELERALKFAVVGCTGIAVNEGLLYILRGCLGLKLAAAGLLAVEASVLNNFTWNDIWTFRDQRPGSLAARCLKYHAAVALGAGVNVAALLALTALGLHYLLSNLAGIALGFLANYMVSRHWVWQQSLEQRRGLW